MGDSSETRRLSMLSLDKDEGGNAATTKKDKDRGSPSPELSERGDTGEVAPEGPIQFFLELKFFEGVRVKVTQMIARSAIKHNFKSGDTILQESNSAVACEAELSNSFFVVEKGSIMVEEHGQMLRKLERGDTCGTLVAFDQMQRQAFTVTCCSEHMSAWVIARHALRPIFKQFPDAKKQLQDHVDAQMRTVLMPRLNSINLFSHCAPKFFSQLVGKTSVEYCEINEELIHADKDIEKVVIVAIGSIRVHPMRITVGHQRSSHLHESAHTLRYLPCSEPLEAWNEHDDEDDSRDASKEGVAAEQVQRQSSKASRKTTQSSWASSGFDGADDEEDDKGYVDDDEDYLTQFSLPECRMVLEPKRAPTTAVAGPDALVFGDGALLGFQMTSPCRVQTIAPCIVLKLSIEDFCFALERHPRERKRFDTIKDAEYQEWKKCHIAQLPKIDIFSKCSPEFLAFIASHAAPKVFFPGDIVMSLSGKKVLLALMAGNVEISTNDEATRVLSGPITFGSLDWLGVPREDSLKVEAITLCQTLTLTVEQILAGLTFMPDDGTAILSTTAKHNGMRTHLATGKKEIMMSTDEYVVGSGRSPAVQFPLKQWHGVWHIPFCEGMKPEFIELFTQELEKRKLVPGQGLVKSMEDPDVLLVVLSGTVRVDDTTDESSDAQVLDAPLVITSFCKRLFDKLTAVTVCSVHSIGVYAATNLAHRFPDDMKALLERAFRYQQRVDAKRGRCWWSPMTTLKRQQEFAESNMALLQKVVEASPVAFYIPGEVVVKEGQLVDSAMLLESGVVLVEHVDERSLHTSDRLGQLEDGDWIGDLGNITANVKRRATIRAQTVCKIMKVMQDSLLELLREYPRERQRFRELAEVRLLLMDDGGFRKFDFFNTFDKRFLNLLSPRCQPHLYFAKEVLMRQGESSDSMFILNEDCNFSLWVDGQKVKDHSGAACLGIPGLLSSKPVRRTATVICTTACSVRKLSRENWLDALKSYPEHRQWILQFTEDQLKAVKEEGADFFRTRTQGKIQSRSKDAADNYRKRQEAVKVLKDGHKKRFDAAHQGKLPNLLPALPQPEDSPSPLPGRPLDHSPGHLLHALLPADLGAVSTPKSPLALTTADKKALSPAQILDLISTPRSAGAASSVKSPAKPQGKRIEDEGIERWACFNGEHVPIPHARLPQLGQPPDALKMKPKKRGTRKSLRQSFFLEDNIADAEIFRRQFSSSCNFDACEDALGLSLPPGAPPSPPPGGAGGLAGAPIWRREDSDD